MSLRIKSLISVVFFSFLVLIIIIVFIQTTLNESFEELEISNVREHVERAMNALEREIQVLSVTNRDWATWDQSYSFAQDPQETFVEDSLSEVTFMNNGFNYIIYMDDSGGIVLQKGLDLLEFEQLILPNDLIERITTEPLFVDMPKSLKRVKGIMTLEQGPTYIVASPILNSKGEGPSPGVLIMGRFLVPSEVEKIAANVKLKVDIAHGTDPRISLPLEPEQVDEGIWVEALDKNRIVGTTQIQDIFGEKSYYLSVTTNRPIYQQGKNSTDFLVMFMIVTSFVFAIIILILLETTILSKISRIMKQVQVIKNSHDFTLRLHHSGSDELNKLMDEFNLLLDKVEQSQDLLVHQASHDPLTNLPNRSFFDEYLAKSLVEAKQKNSIIAILFVDLDGFKAINDQFGHSAGDQLLQIIAMRLHSGVMEKGVVTRSGGDEFLSILSKLSSFEEVRVVAEKILMILKEDMTVQGHSVSISASVGISIFPHDGESKDVLIKKADLAMYRAKEQGKNYYQFYDPTILENKKE